MSSLTNANNIQSSKSFTNLLHPLFTKMYTLPLLPLPKGTWGGGFTDTRITNKSTGKLIAKTPEVDPVLSEYGRKALPLQFTIKFIDYVSQTSLLMDCHLKARS